MKAPYAVIADDLTGAGDTGVQFAEAGLRSRALLGEWDASAVGETDVVVVNTESRPLSHEATYEAVKQTATRLKDAGVLPIYKKIDSTMRGHVGAMIEAVMDTFDLRLAVICPAFPANGRFIAGGYLLVDGEPVARTAISRDPVAPVTVSHIPSLLAKHCRRPVLHVGLDTLDKGPSELGRALKPPKEGALAVVDAANEADLAAIVEAIFGEAFAEDDGSHTEDSEGDQGAASEQGSVLFVGSAGLAAPLAEHLARRRWAEGAGGATGEGAASAAERAVIVACGSVNPVSQKQLAELERSVDAPAIILDVKAALRGDNAWEDSLANAGNEVRRAVSARRGKPVVLATPGERENVKEAQRFGADLGLGPTEVADKIALSLAETVAHVMTDVDAAGIVVTGGDIARSLLSRLEAVGIDLHAEVLPGIPYGTLHGGPHTGLRVVTKAGGFGTPDALAEAARYLANLPPDEGDAGHDGGG